MAELLGEKCPTKITRIGVKDVFGESGPAKELLHKYELDAAVSYTHLDVYKRQDHGNAEQLVNYETGEPLTSHTTNPVPFILVNADPSYTLKEDLSLIHI